MILCKNAPMVFCELDHSTSDCRLVHYVILVTHKNMEEARRGDDDFDRPQQAAGS